MCTKNEIPHFGITAFGNAEVYSGVHAKAEDIRSTVLVICWTCHGGWGRGYRWAVRSWWILNIAVWAATSLRCCRLGRLGSLPGSSSWIFLLVLLSRKERRLAAAPPPHHHKRGTYSSIGVFEPWTESLCREHSITKKFFVAMLHFQKPFLLYVQCVAWMSFCCSTPSSLVLSGRQLRIHPGYSCCFVLPIIAVR